jgi:hypothetical protein
MGRTGGSRLRIKKTEKNVKRILTVLAVVCLWAAAARAQVGGQSTVITPRGSDPANCAPGEFWTNTAASPALYKGCPTANTPDPFVGATPLQKNTYNYAADTGAANAYVVTLSPAPSALTVGLGFYFKAANGNTGASTVALNGLTATAIVKCGSTALASGDIAAGKIYQLVFDGTSFEVPGLCGTGTAAFSALTPSTNSTAGTFSASGNNWNFSAALSLTIPSVSGGATATGQLAFDSGINEYTGYFGSKWIFPWTASANTANNCAYWIGAYQLGNQACGFANPMTGIGDMIGGGASGAATRIPAGKTGQVMVATNGATSAFASPGVADGNGGAPVTTTPYPIGCDSGTALIDRVTTIPFQAGASVITAPDHTASGCGGNMTFTLIDDGAGLLTVNRSGTDTFNIVDGTTNVDGAVSFTLNNGQYATLNNGRAGIWEVRKAQNSSLGTPASLILTNATGLAIGATPLTTSQDILYDNAGVLGRLPIVTVGNCLGNTGGVWASLACSGGGSSALSALTAATASNTIANGNNPQTWNCAQTTDAQDCMAFGETSASTNGTVNGSGLANQAIVSISTLSGSTATPLEIVQGAVTGGTAYPGMQLECTWNGAAVNKCLIVSVTNTATGGGSHILDLLGGAAGTTNEFNVDSAGNTTINGSVLVNGASISAKAAANTLVFQGGSDNGAATVGPGVFRGADNNTTASGGRGGDATLRGGNEVGSTVNQLGAGNVNINGGNVTLSTTSASSGGNVTISGGTCNSVAAANTCGGTVKVVQPYFSTGTAAVNDLACVTATNTVASCSGTATATFVGVIDTSSTNVANVAILGTGGTHNFNATSATFTNGHFVCQSAVSANLVVDSSTACSLGTGIGIYIGATGTQTSPLVWMKNF